MKITSEWTLKMIRLSPDTSHLVPEEQSDNIVEKSTTSTTVIHYHPSSDQEHWRQLPSVNVNTVKINSRYRLTGSSRLASSSPTGARRSGSVPPSSTGTRPYSSTSNHSSGSGVGSPISATSTSNLAHYRELYYNMSYVLLSTEDFHRGPTRISTIDPYLHEKVPLTVIKDTIYFQAEPQYDPHGRFWKFRVEDSPVRVLNKLLDLGYKVLTGTCVPMENQKQIGHAWTLLREPTARSSNAVFSLDNWWTGAENIGPMFAVSTLNSVKLYSLEFMKNRTLDDKKFREILRHSDYVYDKISVSLKHNLVIYTKVNTDTLFAVPIRNETNMLGINTETNLGLSGVKTFAVDWLDENIYIANLKKTSKMIIMYSLKNVKVPYKIETASGMIKDILVDTTNNFLAWVEDNYRIVMANKDGEQSRVIAEIEGIQSIDFDQETKRFFIHVSSNSNTTIYSQSYTPEGLPFEEKQLTIPKNNKVMETIFYRAPDVELLLVLYGDADPHHKGFELRFEYLEKSGLGIIQHTQHTPMHLQIPMVPLQGSVQISKVEPAKPSLSLIGVRSINLVWTRPVDNYCKTPQCNSISTRLPVNKCKCLCQVSQRPCDKFVFEPSETTSTAHQEKREPHAMPPQNYIIPKEKDWDFSFSLVLFLIPFVLCLCGFVIYRYIELMNNDIQKFSNERLSSSSSLEDMHKTNIGTKGKKGIKKKSKNKVQTFLSYFYSGVDIKSAPKDKYNLYAQPEEPSENYSLPDDDPTKSIRLKYKRSKKSLKNLSRPVSRPRSKRSKQSRAVILKSLKSDKSKSRNSKKSNKPKDEASKKSKSLKNITKNDEQNKSKRLKNKSTKSLKHEKQNGSSENTNSVPSDVSQETITGEKLQFKTKSFKIDGPLQLSLLQKKPKSTITESASQSSLQLKKTTPKLI